MSSRERKRDIHPCHTFKRKPRAANCELNLRWHGTRLLFCFIFLTCQYLREKAPYSVFDFKLLQFICLFVWLCTFLFISPEKLSIGRSIIEMIKNINLFLIIFFLKDAACHILCFFFCLLSLSWYSFGSFSTLILPQYLPWTQSAPWCNPSWQIHRYPLSANSAWHIVLLGQGLLSQEF